jgi:O-antigen ligase
VVVPAYLLLALLLGGSGQGVWANMVLQVLGVAIIGWAALAPKGEPLAPASRDFLVLAALAVLLLILQLAPLPPAFWTGLPGRDLIEAGYRSLGYPLPALPLSIAPYQTVSTALTLLPPLAVLVGIVRLHASQASWIAGAVVAGAFLGVLLGTIQTVGGRGPDAWWYLYKITNTGAVGFFANRNHMGTLLLVSIPLAVALIAGGSAKHRERGRSQAMLAMGAGGFLLVLVGLALNGSLAALALSVPTIAFSTLILPGGWRWRGLALPLAAIATVAAVLVFASSPIHSELAGSDTTSFDSRLEIWNVTAAAIAETFPAGTGVGTFEQAYRLLEDPATITRTYVNHAHNDYLEVLLEAGAAGLLLMLAFLLWWGGMCVKVWRSPLSSHFARAATIASGVVLAHSIVDFPLRTAAIATVFAACLAMMAQPSRKRLSDDASELRPARHMAVG